MKKVTIGMLAAVDSGKTTLTEAILYKTGKIRQAGRVDHGDSHMDTDAIERERGITIFSKQAEIEYGGMKATILDTPGHVDFAAEMERTLSVIDYAVLIIGANDGIKAHTATLWKLLQKHRIPVFVFVNKIDLAKGTGEVSSVGGTSVGAVSSVGGTSVGAVSSVGETSAGAVSPGAEDFVDGGLRTRLIGDISKGLGAKFTDFTDTGSEEFLDDISLVSDKAAELVLADMDDRERGEAIDLEVIRLIKGREVFPIYFGSALKMSGVEELLAGVVRYTAVIPGDEKGEPSGRIFKVAFDGQDRVTFVKLTGGKLKPRQVVRIIKRNEADSPAGTKEKIKAGTLAGTQEKINEIRVYSGEKYTVLDTAGPGDVVALTGISDAVPGDVIGNEEPSHEEVLQPYMTYNAHAVKQEETHALIDALNVLAAEDPKLEAEWLSRSEQIIVRIMGAVQLEVLTRIIRDRFRIECVFDEEKIIYKETIGGTYEGVGHFEPLRHYSEAHLIISPAERGSGITIRSECPLEMLDINWQNLVMSVLERHHLRGTLTGASLTDVDICLVAGRASKKHTEGGDFREAALRAVRQGLMQARAAGDMVLLEPWLDFRVETEVPEIGAIMTDIDNMGGSVDPPEILEDGSTAVLTGRAPAAGLRGYGARLAGSAHGRTQFSCAMGGYDVCANAEDVIERAAYDPDHDVRNPADSVFCSHGSGDIVKWDDVFGYMHIPSVLEARRKHQSILPSGQTDEALAAEARIAEQRRRREQRAATDKELKAIFEQTYGPIRHYRRPKAEAYSEYTYYDENGNRIEFDKDGNFIGYDESEGSNAQAGASGPNALAGDGGDAGKNGAGANNPNAQACSNGPNNPNAQACSNGPNSSNAQACPNGANGFNAQTAVRGSGKAPKSKTPANDSVTYLFVDGYNLIHAWPELKELADMDFGAARDELTDIICNYSGFMGYHTVLVYDAYKVTEGVGSKLQINGITVVYTREHETADAYIERETLNIMKRIKAGKSGRIIVVTSDNLEQIVSMGHGALRISSREFVEEIGRANDSIRSMH